METVKVKFIADQRSANPQYRGFAHGDGQSQVHCRSTLGKSSISRIRTWRRSKSSSMQINARQILNIEDSHMETVKVKFNADQRSANPQYRGFAHGDGQSQV